MRFNVRSVVGLQSDVLYSLCYGLFVFTFVSSWSFDFKAVQETVEYFKKNELSYFEILAFNSFTTYMFTKFLNGYEAEFIVSLYYGICATFRFLIYRLLLPWIWFIPVFLSMAVMLDFNTSRYSLAISVFILFYGVLIKNNFKGIAIAETSILSIIFFHLHHFSVAFIALFSNTGYVFRTVVICMVPFSIVLFDDVFSRFLLTNTDPFPRITIVYFAFSILLIMSRKISKQELKVLYTILILLLGFYLSRIQFNAAYYTRFSFLAFDVILITIAINTQGIRIYESKIIFHKKYLKVLIICSLSVFYQSILISGNIWRFF